ncbi:MAG: peptidyl-prolyl cis-trans isomerase [Puniceicoccales bacterium]|jgi:parvulin-like peptidyl-prolyl isomerase|nr:peptidyl-prolyl cis-trans isomerase [Puniceicoccales bacterium]
MSSLQKFSSTLIFTFCLLFSATTPAVAGEAASSPAPESEEFNREKFQVPIYSNDIVAIVNNEIVTATQLMKEIAPFIPRIRAESRSQADFLKKIREYQEVVLNAFIERILIVEEFKSRGGRVPESYERKEYESYVANEFAGDRVAFSKYLMENGQSVREFKKSIRDHTIVSFVLSDVQKSKTEISPIKIRDYYDSHSQDFVIDRKIFIKSIILEKGKYSPEELAAKLAALQQAFESRDSIQTLIEKFSDFPQASQIEWISIGDLIHSFVDAINNTQIGRLSNPVELDGKIYILFPMDEKPAKKFTLDEVKGNIEEVLASKYQMEVKRKFIDKLREKAYIKIFI